MNTTKWNDFFALVDDCYGCMMGDEDADYTSWKKSFELFKELVKEERETDPAFASEFVMIDEAMDFDSDVEDWLTECLDEMDINEEYDTLLGMCDDLLELFKWPDYVGSDIKFLKARTMAALERRKDCADFCKCWLAEEPDNIVAATATVYAFIGTEEYAIAEELINKFLEDKSYCDENNDLMFIAAATLYQVMGNMDMAEQLKKAIEEYDQRVEEQYEGEEVFGDEFGDEFGDNEL